MATGFIVAVAALVIRDGRILSLRRAPDSDASPGVWETLSGRVEPGEEPLAAVKRETDEECGLIVRFDTRPFAARHALRNGLPMIVIHYRARHVAGEVRLSAEHDDFAWLTADEFSVRCPIPELVDVVNRALEDGADF